MLIHLMNFLCCVVGAAKSALAVPQCGIVFHHCCQFGTAILFISFLIFVSVRARAGDESWMAMAFSFAIPSATSLPVTPECQQTHDSSIWHVSFVYTNSLIVSSTSLLVGFTEKMDCSADRESVHSFTFVPFSLWGFKISHNSVACMATTSAWKTETSPRAPPPSPITTSPRLARKAKPVLLPLFEASVNIFHPRMLDAVILHPVVFPTAHISRKLGGTVLIQAVIQ